MKNSHDKNIKITKFYDYSTNCKRKFLLAGKKYWLKKNLSEENYHREKILSGENVDRKK